MKALIVDEPWISRILSGEKTWEMRSTHTSVRGRIALVRKGSGLVVGLADLVDSIGPLDEIAWRAHQARHGIPLDQHAATARWNIAWELRNVSRLASAVPYAHPNGAVIWVNLSDEEAATLRIESMRLPAPRSTEMPRFSESVQPRRASATHAGDAQGLLVPVSRDGSWFRVDLRGPRGYTIGAKGEEVVVAQYSDALAQLRAMKTARWRRPNGDGNWGIVAAVDWKAVDQMVGEQECREI